MQEIWKFYKETYAPRWGKRVYYVSNLGNVKCNGELYICSINRGYKGIGHERLHRIVAKLFIPNPYNYDCVDHLDNNKLNNRVDNLRWCTKADNNRNIITKENWSKQRKGSIPWNKGLVGASTNRQRDEKGRFI